MAVVRLEIKTRQPLADGRKFDHVGCYEQLDGTAHFAVDPAHRLNCAVTDIDLAERGRDGLVHFTADVRILAPADQARGNHRLLFDVPNRGNRLALATFNGVPRPINPAGPTDAGNGFLMRHGYTVVWCGWQHDVPEADGLMRIKVPEAQIDGRPVSGRLLVGFQPSKPSQVQLLSDRGHRPYPSDDLDNPNAVLLVRAGEEARPRTIPRESWSFARLEARRIVPDPNHVYLATGFEPGRIYEVIYTTTGAPVIGLGLLAARDIVSFLRHSNGADNPCAGDIQHAYAFGASQSGRFLRQLLYLGLTKTRRNEWYSTACWFTSPAASAAATSTCASGSRRRRCRATRSHLMRWVPPIRSAVGTMGSWNASPCAIGCRKSSSLTPRANIGGAMPR